MEILFLCLIVFLFMLAVFDLSVGVSNDAVNFLNSAIGSKAAPFKRVLIVASLGVFLGAAMSNGMMDIARHGIFRPEYFSFYDILCIFMAVMVTDIILLDIFNTLGLPTSTTVSMVFELLGASFVVAIIKIFSGESGVGLNELINTEKALTVIIGIFLSVAIAFVFGTVVQFLTRLLFTFDYRRRMKWKIGIFGGVCATAIIYFLLIKGVRNMAFMTPEIKAVIDHNTGWIIAGCLVGLTVIMQILHMLRVNVLKVIVLMGTFSLAMAFAGNDLVNFIGVPLSGLSAYNDYAANGDGNPMEHMMVALNNPADTSVWFLVGAGLIMVIALATSKKARKVSQTEIGLGSSVGGDEMFGSSRLARRIVRWSLSAINQIKHHTPLKMRRWFGARFNTLEAVNENGEAFDLVRGAVNLVLAGALIALGTSMKLPLSTTFVTFMVAMGTSLADRAWGRESAVFRITGVISVIGGWFMTAGAAFIGAGIIVLAMHSFGVAAMFVAAILTVFLIIRSNRRFRESKPEEGDDAMFNAIVASNDSENVWPVFMTYLKDRQARFLSYAEENYRVVTAAFVKENVKALDKAESSLMKEKQRLKNDRRKETLCFRKLGRETAIEKSTWFYLGNNCCMSILYNLRRINEICKEHVENNFLPLPERYVADFENVREKVSALFTDTLAIVTEGMTDNVDIVRRECEITKNQISDTYHSLYTHIREGDPSTMTVLYVYLNMLQETREMVSSLRKFIRAYAKILDNNYSGR